MGELREKEEILSRILFSIFIMQIRKKNSYNFSDKIDTSILQIGKNFTNDFAAWIPQELQVSIDQN